MLNRHWPGCQPLYFLELIIKSAIAVAKALAGTVDFLYVHQDLLPSVLQHPFMSATHQGPLWSSPSPVTHVPICIRLNCSLNSSSLLLKTDCVYMFWSPRYSKIIIHLTLLTNRRHWPSAVCLRHTRFHTNTHPAALTHAQTHMHTQRVATNRRIQMPGQAVHSRSALALCNSAWCQHRLAPVCWGNTLLKSCYMGIVITHWPRHPQTAKPKSSS